MPLGTLDSLDETNLVGCFCCCFFAVNAWMFKGPRTTWENIIFSKKSVVFFFLVVVFGKICWILSPANLTKTLMEKIPFWGIEERFGESGWSREI